jgi:hypothetical protein
MKKMPRLKERRCLEVAAMEAIMPSGKTATLIYERKRYLKKERAGIWKKEVTMMRQCLQHKD